MTDEPDRRRGDTLRTTSSQAPIDDAVRQLVIQGSWARLWQIDRTAEVLEFSANSRGGLPVTSELLRALFEQRAPALSHRVEQIATSALEPGCKLNQLIALQAEAAVQMRRYIPYFFSGARLPPDVSVMWRSWNRQFESAWADVVGACMDAGDLARSDPLITTRLILGMVMWSVERGEQAEKMTAQQVIDSVVTLLRLERRAI